MIATLAGLALATLGVGFVIVAGLGVIRLPDAFQRMHAATKAGTLGAALVLLGACLVLGTGSAWLTGALTILVLLLTLPLGAQMLGRAAYMSGSPLRGLGGRDALAGILRREPDPLTPREPLPPTERPDAARPDPADRPAV